MRLITAFHSEERQRFDQLVFLFSLAFEVQLGETRLKFCTQLSAQRWV